MKSFPRITSRENQKLKAVRRVRDGKDKTLIFIEGARLVEEALRSGIEITAACISTSFGKKARNCPMIERLAASGAGVSELPDELFSSIADTESSQGIVTIAHRPPTREFVIEKAESDDKGCPIVIFLNRVNNPLNLGAIVRTAEAAGALGVITSQDSADVFSPKALRASMGSTFRLPVWPSMRFDEALSLGKRYGLTTTAADVGGKIRYSDLDWTVPRLLVFGSEAHGLDANDREKVDELTFIPMENDVESLNLAVAAGIVLFEARRQVNLINR